MNNVIGKIACTDVIENNDGTATIVFDVDKQFKDNYKKLFGLKRWSVKHFEEKLIEALEKRVQDAK